MTTTRVIVALDFADPANALALAGRLDPASCALKVGKEMFVTAGPEPVRAMIARGFRVFLDLKFHDIPNTVGLACAAATRLGVWMLNVHAAGGRGDARGGARGGRRCGGEAANAAAAADRGDRAHQPRGCRPAGHRGRAATRRDRRCASRD